MEDYITYSLPIISKIADWERGKGTAACMVNDEEKVEFWNFISKGFILGSPRAAMQALGEEF